MLAKTSTYLQRFSFRRTSCLWPAHVFSLALMDVNETVQTEAPVEILWSSLVREMTILMFPLNTMRCGHGYMFVTNTMVKYSLPMFVTDSMVHYVWPIPRACKTRYDDQWDSVVLIQFSSQAQCFFCADAPVESYSCFAVG